MLSIDTLASSILSVSRIGCILLSRARKVPIAAKLSSICNFPLSSERFHPWKHESSVAQTPIPAPVVSASIIVMLSMYFAISVSCRSLLEWSDVSIPISFAYFVSHMLSSSTASAQGRSIPDFLSLAQAETSLDASRWRNRIHSSSCSSLTACFCTSSKKPLIVTWVQTSCHFRIIWCVGFASFGSFDSTPSAVFLFLEFFETFPFPSMSSKPYQSFPRTPQKTANKTTTNPNRNHNNKAQDFHNS
mmetsp:Transcript_21289/g.87037  ORF Transcript_21289/g.87037 Transcript_21289/m.87037 type:complete len:246 (+) Transcript_21289:304-1041(+)